MKALSALVISDAATLQTVIAAYHSEPRVVHKLVLLSIIKQSTDAAVHDLLVREASDVRNNVAVRDEALRCMRFHLPSVEEQNERLDRCRSLLEGLVRDEKESLRLRRSALGVLAHAADRVSEDFVRVILATSREPELLAEAMTAASGWRNAQEFAERAKELLIDAESFQGEYRDLIVEAAVHYLASSGTAGRAYLVDAIAEPRESQQVTQIIEGLASYALEDPAVRERLTHLMLTDSRDEIRIAVMRNMTYLSLPKEYLNGLRILVARQENSTVVRVAAAESLISHLLRKYESTDEACAFLAQVIKVDPQQTFREKIRAILKDRGFESE